MNNDTQEKKHKNNQPDAVLTGAVAFAFLFAFAFVLPWTELGFLLFAFATFLLSSYIFAVEPTRLLRPKARVVAVGEPRTVVETHSGLKVFVGSWNVGDAAPSNEDASLSSWIPKEKYDIYAIGAQECAYKPRAPHTTCEEDWIALLQRHVGDQYKIVGSTSTREAIRLVVFVKPELDGAVSNVLIASTLTQLPFFWRKGANGIAFDLFDTSFCFVNAHLSAHQNQVRARENDVHCIIRSLFKSCLVSSDSPAAALTNSSSVDLLVSRFDNVVFFGDLNYRINSSKDVTESLLKSEKWDELLTYDQLNKEHGAQRLFANMKLVNPQYGPTYKFLTSKKETSSGPKRTYASGRRPAWCDRILFSNGFVLSKSGCPDNIRSSDHSPIFAVLEATANEYVDDKDEDKLEPMRLNFDHLEATLSIPVTPRTATQIQITSEFFQMNTPICQGGSVWKEAGLAVNITALSVEVLRKQRINVSVVDFSNIWSFEQGFGTICLEEVSLTEPASFKIPLFFNSKRVGELKGTLSLHK